MVILIIGGLYACRTARKQKGSHFFQNVSAKYNILFNGNELLDDVRTKRLLEYRENYQAALPVFIDPGIQEEENTVYLMDSVIQKANTIINTKDQSRYIPQAYFMMARAQYEKGNFYEASELFRYVSQIANPQDFQLKEEAYSWHARMLLLTGRLHQAAVSIDSAFAQASHRNKKALAITEATKAAWLMKSQATTEAIPYLQQAIKASKSQKEKLRWQYLHGQLLEQGQAYAEAYAIYTKVAKSNAAFELSFNAALRCEAIESRQDPDRENHVQRLKKLARNNKSIGFTDQIHYLIAESYLKANDTTNATEHLKISVREGGRNDFQRTGSYLALADLYFDQKQYGIAKAYYDSTANLLNSNYPAYRLISEKIAHIDELIAHWNTIAREDTLRALAQLPVELRERAIDSLIQNKVTQKKEQEDISISGNTELTSTGPIANSNEPILPNVLSSDHFYFNNPTAVGAGMATFRRRWGNRPLEDGWRWSNKPNMASARAQQRPAGTEATSLGTAAVVGNQQVLMNRTDYLHAVPDNEAKWQSSDQRISDALLQIGNLYRDVLKDPDHAIASYKQLLDRYPQSTVKDEIYYNLYRLYGDVGQQDNKTLYRTRLVEEFPQSRYSKSISDLYYLKTLQAERATLDSLYTRAYGAYAQQDFDQVKILVDHAKNKEKGDENQRVYAQLAYLKALSVGRTASIQEYEKELKHIVASYPNDPLLSPIVKQQLSFIEENRDSLDNRTLAIAEINANRQRFEHEPNMTKWPELVFHADGQELIAEPRQVDEALATKSKPNTTTGIKPFNENKVVKKQSTRNLELLPDTETYYFVVDVRLATANLSPSRYGIGQFNRSHASTKMLRHQLMTVQDAAQLIYIGQFNEYDEVKTYANRIALLMKDIMKVPQENYDTFIITQQNLELLTDEDKLNTYIDLYNSSNP